MTKGLVGDNDALVLRGELGIIVSNANDCCVLAFNCRGSPLLERETSGAPRRTHYEYLDCVRIIIRPWSVRRGSGLVRSSSVRMPR
jgi:hypothetical protein